MSLDFPFQMMLGALLWNWTMGANDQALVWSRVGGSVGLLPSHIANPKGTTSLKQKDHHKTAPKISRTASSTSVDVGWAAGKPLKRPHVYTRCWALNGFKRASPTWTKSHGYPVRARTSTGRRTAWTPHFRKHIWLLKDFKSFQLYHAN